jgi:hypothetical protein
LRDRDEAVEEFRQASWSDQLVIVSVSANPEPMDPTWNIETQRSIVITDSYRPQFSDALEVKGRVMRVRFQELKVLISQRANIVRESLIRGPKP